MPPLSRRLSTRWAICWIALAAFPPTVAGPDGPSRLAGGQIRLPDISFLRWDRLPADDAQRPFVELAPDLAIEILSRGNTPREMERKRKELFAGGTRLMWLIDPASRTVAVYVDADSAPVILSEDQSVDGQPVLPGFSFSIRQLFAEAQKPQG
jgi:Uma2 family endonuclease